MHMPANAPSWLHQFGFDRLDRSPFELRLDEDRVADSLDRMCQAITDELLIRRALGKEHREYQPPRGWMKTVCYNAIQTCMYHDVLDELADRQERFGRSERGPDADRSIFDDALMGIFAHERPVRGKELLDRKDRERLAEEMWWGFRNYMEPSELIAFNRAYPFHRKGNYAPPDDVAPSLYWKIVKRRFLFRYQYDRGMNVDEYRGAYCPRLNDDFEGLHGRYMRCVHKHSVRFKTESATLHDEDDDAWDGGDDDVT
jgi:hypothetical protein